VSVKDQSDEVEYQPFLHRLHQERWCLLQERICKIEWRTKEGKEEATDQFYEPVML